VADADVVTASNSVLATKHASERQDILLIENGVDPRRFSPIGDAVDLGGSPVVGYHGAIAEWFDFELVKQLAQMRPQYTFVLVGPVSDGSTENLAVLTSIENVVHFPQQSVEGVAEFVRSFWVGLIPFVINEMTEGVTPLKMYEALASGKPVVATPLPACVEHRLVTTGVDAGSMAGLLDEAVAIDDSGRLQLSVVAEVASWTNRIEPLRELLGELGLLRVPSH